MESPASKNQQPQLITRAWYGAPILEFLQSEPETILGTLTKHSEFAALPAQAEAWSENVGQR